MRTGELMSTTPYESGGICSAEYQDAAVVADLRAISFSLGTNNETKEEVRPLKRVI